jgi:hypothetical protein
MPFVSGNRLPIQGAHQRASGKCFPDAVILILRSIFTRDPPYVGASRIIADTVPCAPGLVYIAVQPESQNGHLGVTRIAISSPISND